MDQQRLDRIEERLDRIAVLQAEMLASLREHIRRTEIAENNIERTVAAIQPLQNQALIVQWVGRVLTVLITSGAALASIWQILGP